MLKHLNVLIGSSVNYLRDLLTTNHPKTTNAVAPIKILFGSWILEQNTVVSHANWEDPSVYIFKPSSKSKAGSVIKLA